MTPIRLGMDMKKARHFLCGLLCGAAGVYWYTFSAEETLAQVLSWLESAANEYRATHDVPTADSGWGVHKKDSGNGL
jgi:hypothetical protein